MLAGPTSRENIVGKLKKSVAALARADAASKPPPSTDALNKLRDKVRRARDIEQEVASIQERAQELQKEKQEILFKELPDLYEEYGVDKLGLEAEGNLPAYDTELKPYYHANIPKDGEDEAFAWLEKNKHGDLIKTKIIVEMGRGDRALAKKVEAALKKLKVPYSSTLGVPWNTLTAFVREQIEQRQTTPPLAILGATVGRVVTLKPRKEKK